MPPQRVNSTNKLINELLENEIPGLKVLKNKEQI